MRRRPRIAAALAVLATFLLAGTVLAKDDAIVTLDASLPADPTPGSELTLGWTVEVLGAGGQMEPFNAEAMFIRLIPSSGEPVEAVGQQNPLGHYVATITVPAGGIREVEVGLRGESCSAGKCQPSDILFAIDQAKMPVFEPAAGSGTGAAVAEANEPAAASGDSTSPVAPTSDLAAMALAALAVAGATVVTGLIVLRLRGRRLSAGASES